MISIMRPKLPSGDRLHPYLKAIDANRTYSNFGPLVLSFEERLAAHYGLGIGTVATVANATLGLTLALASQGAKPGTLCAMPAWTFVASAHAAVLAGLVPYFVDIDLTTWAIDPDDVADAIAAAPAPVGAVMPVMPFGQPIDMGAWEKFQTRTGLPVVIDAAAAFDSLTPSSVPAVVSLHATKVMGVGEGGFVVSTDENLARSVRARSNFGFDGTREATVPAANAKLSEYHAAVGLAALDEWAEVRMEWMAAARTYRQSLPLSNQMRFQNGFGQDWVASTCVLGLANAAAEGVGRALNEAGIETRKWWGHGSHRHPATKEFPRASLPATDTLARATLAIPFYRDLGETDARHIVGSLRAAVEL
jgi:dTDP-4-amino-4,6-dideoxygalactose transaminase